MTDVNVHDVMAAYLAGLVTKLNEKEIWWQDKNGYKITVELVDADLETYVVREYHRRGRLWYEENYLNDQLHGLRRIYDRSGKLYLEENYCEGRVIDSKKYLDDGD